MQVATQIYYRESIEKSFQRRWFLGKSIMTSTANDNLRGVTSFIFFIPSIMFETTIFDNFIENATNEQKRFPSYP